jgi:hypothetical protein
VPRESTSNTYDTSSKVGEMGKSEYGRGGPAKQSQNAESGAEQLFAIRLSPEGPLSAPGDCQSVSVSGSREVAAASRGGTGISFREAGVADLPEDEDAVATVPERHKVGGIPPQHSAQKVECYQGTGLSNYAS